jgi:hypothetical protein
LKLFYILIISFFLVNVSKAQIEFTDIGARAIGMNGAYTSISDNSLAIFYNPSGLGQMKYREFSVFYSPAPFGLTELSTSALTYAEPFKFGTLGIGIKNYGFDLYREIGINLSYGGSYKKKIFYGLNLNYYNLKIKDNYNANNSASSAAIDIGLMAYITKFLRWGFLGKNISGSTIGVSKDKIAQVYRTGFSLVSKGNLSFGLEAEKDVRYALSVRAGMEYCPMDYVDIRAGVGSEPTTFTFGIGFSYNLFQLDYALYNSPDLGLTHQGTFTVNFGGIKGKKENRHSMEKAFIRF